MKELNSRINFFTSNCQTCPTCIVLTLVISFVKNTCSTMEVINIKLNQISHGIYSVLNMRNFMWETTLMLLSARMSISFFCGNLSADDGGFLSYLHMFF